MRPLLSIISFIVLAFCSCGQTKPEKYYFSEIGTSVLVPTDFNSRDSFTRPQFLDSNQKAMIEPQAIEELSAEMMKLLLIVESGDNKSSMSINILPVTKKSLQTMGDSAQYLEFSKVMHKTSTRQLANDFDTIFTTIKIDRTRFNKLFTKAKVGRANIYNGMYYTKIKDFYLVIKIEYENETSGEKLKSIIEGAKFD
jgi:hypothetical protein